MPLFSKQALKDINKYHSILKFPFIFNLIEEMVGRSVEEHLEHNVSHNAYQSAYRRGHLTEVSLLKLESSH